MKDFGPAVIRLVKIFGWNFLLVENLWSIFDVIRNRDVNFRKNSHSIEGMGSRSYDRPTYEKNRTATEELIAVTQPFIGATPKYFSISIANKNKKLKHYF